MPRCRIAVLGSFALVVPAVACAAGNAHSAIRLEGGFPVPGSPALFQTRYDPSFSLRAVGDGPIAEHLSLRMSAGYSEFSHARTRTYVSAGDGWNLSSLWGLTIWPLASTAPVHPYATIALGMSSFELKDLVINTGTRPRQVASDFKSGLGSALELGALAFPGGRRWGMSVAAERVGTDSPMGMVTYMSYTAGFAYRFTSRR